MQFTHNIWLILLFGMAIYAAYALITMLFNKRMDSLRRAYHQDLEIANARLQHLALHDVLTGLPNRTLLRDRLDQSIVFAERYRERFAVLTLGIDRFKTINDSLGYGTGDELLRQVAQRLAGAVSKENTLSRSGGDEFVILVPDVRDRSAVEGMARRLIELFRDRFDIHPHEFHTTASIGISIYPADGVTVDALLARSDEGLMHAKKMGRNTFRFFSAGMATFNHQTFELEHELRHALGSNQFLLHYQPKVDVSTGSIIGVEALLRWIHPLKGSIPPDRFIPLAEDTGLIVPIGEWVLREACQQARRWRDAGLPFLRMAVNLSALQFRQPHLEEVIRSAIADAGIEPDVLELELTESAIMSDAEESVAIFKKLSAQGVLISIDDFGKGYSSMSYLQRFPIDKLKIDRSFVAGLPANRDSAAIVKMVISLAHSLRLKVVAEGVESHGQLDFLRGLECDQYQGFLCSRPVLPAEIERLVHARNRTGRSPESELLRTHSRLAAFSVADAADLPS